MAKQHPYTQLSLRELRRDERFLLVAKVEHHIPFPPPHGHREDLFGILDIIAIGPGISLGVQVTSAGSKSAHKKKLLEHENTRKVLESGWVIELHTWRKVPRGRAVRWELDRLTFEL